MTYETPPNPIPPHLVFWLGTGAVIAGLAALVFVVCATAYRWPSAPVNLTGMSAAFLGGAAMLVWCANRVIENQVACLHANREASRAEVDKARKTVRTELTTLRRDLDARETARLAAAFTPVQANRLHAVEEPHGMG